MDQCDEEFDPQIERWHVGHKAECDRKNRYYRPLKEAWAKVKFLQEDFALQEERRADAQRMLAQAEADKKLAEEKAAADAIRAQELARVQLAAAKAAEAAEAERKRLWAAGERGRALEEKERARQIAAGAAERARELQAEIAAPPVAAPPVPRAAPTKIHGQSFATAYGVKIINADLVPIAFRPCCEHCVALLEAQAARTGLATKIPGVEVYAFKKSTQKR